MGKKSKKQSEKERQESKAGNKAVFTKVGLGGSRELEKALQSMMPSLGIGGKGEPECECVMCVLTKTLVQLAKSGDAVAVSMDIQTFVEGVVINLETGGITPQRIGELTATLAKEGTSPDVVNELNGGRAGIAIEMPSGLLRVLRESIALTSTAGFGVKAGETKFND